MKIPIKYFSIAIFVAFLSINSHSFAQVGIGIASPNANAMLDLTTSTKGFLPPRLSTVQKTALGAQLLLSPLPEDNGMLVFDTTLTAYYFWNDGNWVGLASGDYVDLTNDQMMIGGMKTFTNGVTVEGMLIPEGRLMLPMGEISYYNYSSGHSVAIGAFSSGASGNDNMVKISPPSVTFINDSFDLSLDEIETLADTRLKYTGVTTRYFHIALSFSFTPGSNSDTFVFGVAKGNDEIVPIEPATVQNSSKIFNKASQTTDYQSSAMHVLLKLKQNDYIEFFVGKIGSIGSVTIRSINFVAIGM